MASHGALRAQAYERVERHRYYNENVAGLTALERHRQLLAQLPGSSGLRAQDGDKEGSASDTITDAELLARAHRFIRGQADDADTSYGARLARRYYDRLFKEYAIADLSRYKQQQIGLRWRTKAEVVTGKGQFVCGARGCDERAGLATFEVPFSYREANICKQALVKLRVCSSCAAQLNYGRSSAPQGVQAGVGAAAHTTRNSREHHRRKRRRRVAGDSDDGSSHGDGDASPPPCQTSDTCHGHVGASRSPGRGGPNAVGHGATRITGGGGERHDLVVKVGPADDEFEAIIRDIIAAEDAALTARRAAAPHTSIDKV